MVALGRNDTGLARFVERFDDALVGIEGFVGQQSVGLHVRQQRVSPLQIMGLARGQEEAEWIAQSIATPSLIRWSIQEVRRIAIRLARKRIQPAHIIAWSFWRRAHQAAA